MDYKKSSIVVIGALVLAVASCLAADAERPRPGTVCKSSADCNQTYSKMSCVSVNGGQHLCECEKFKLPKSELSAPDFNLKLGKCFVRIGVPCGLVDSAIECEPGSSCALREGEVGVGVCKKGACDKGSSPDKCKDGSGSGHFPASPLILAISMVLALVLKN